MRFGVEHPAVNGVFFQPVTHTGRHPAFDPLDRLTNVEVIRGLCAQLPEWFREDDFVAVPCCSPTCRSATYALYDGEDLVPLPRLVDIDRYLGFVTNRAVPDLEVAAALGGLFSASAAGGTERTGDRLECVACGVGLPDELQRVAARGFMVVAQDFQDEWTLDVAQAAQVLRRRDRPGRPDHPVLRVQRRRLPRAGPRRPGRRGERVIAGALRSARPRGRPQGLLRAAVRERRRALAARRPAAPGRRAAHAAARASSPASRPARASSTSRAAAAPPRSCSRASWAASPSASTSAPARSSRPDAPRAAGARASFLLGDAEALPLPDASFDVALSECSLCTFPDKPRAIAEMARVVRPGGSIAIADVTADLDALPAELRSAAARVACVADARSADEYAALLRDAGCEPLAIEPHDAELRAMADRVEARLRVARMLAPPGDQRERIREAAALARLAIDAIARGHLGYALITARV